MRREAQRRGTRRPTGKQQAAEAQSPGDVRACGCFAEGVCDGAEGGHGQQTVRRVVNLGL